MSKVFYVSQENGKVVHTSSHALDPQTLIGVRPFKKVGEHISQSGFYSFNYIPTEWEVSLVRVSEEGDIYATVINSPLLGDEYDALIEPISAAISPDSFEGDVEDFRAFLKSLGISNNKIDAMIYVWQNQGGSADV